MDEASKEQGILKGSAEAESVSQTDLDALLSAASAHPPSATVETEAAAVASHHDPALAEVDSRSPSAGADPIASIPSNDPLKLEESLPSDSKAPAAPPLPLMPFALDELGTPDATGEVLGSTAGHGHANGNGNGNGNGHGNGTTIGIDAHRVTMLHDVNLRVKIELGRTWMMVEDVLKLGEGSVVELDKLAGDPVDVYVNERLIARGEVLVLNDSFCVRISEVLSHDPHRVSP